MTRPFKLAIVRASTDGSKIADDVCRTYLMTGPQSLLTYWSDVTNGWLDFLDSAMFPWVTITVDPSYTDRISTAASAFAAVRSANPGGDPLAGYDGALVILHPGKGDVAQRDAAGNVVMANGVVLTTPNTGFDGGSGSVGGLLTSIVPSMPSDHTFACHELGHTLGFDHTYGVACSGVDYANTGALGPEYGSPYDLMSSGTFGSRFAASGVTRLVNPTFAGTSVAGWPGSFDMGPALSRANLHRYFPAAIAGQTIDAPFPAVGASSAHRIARASEPTAHTLMVLHPPGEPASGVGRVYVEYRPAENWDRGLDGAGGGMSRAGVVVHTLEDIPTKDPHVWFRGSIGDDDPDTDLAVEGRPLVVTVSRRGDAGAGEHWVELTVTATATQAATASLEMVDTIDRGIDITRRSTPCHDQVATGTWFTKSKGIARVTTTGLEPDITDPTVTVDWRTGDTPLPFPGASGVSVTAEDGSAQSILYSVDPGTHELSIFSEPGATYALTLTASVATSNPAVGTTARVEASATFSPSGRYTGLDPGSIAALGKCLAKNAPVLGVQQIDVAALLDHHEIIGWEQDIRMLQGVVATATGDLADQFRLALDVTVVDAGPQVLDLSGLDVLRDFH